ncbi:hypothetical protein ABIA39_002783 [Nocardia sp. GAS34]|uniref:hypothetical protein n=1 Tax=unclassified Nocardia TaxID=2637762 RepID=UPI003D1DAF24
MAPARMYAIGLSPAETVAELSWPEARLLELDPDLEALFAEVDQVLCEARARWWPLPPREPHMRRPRPGQRRRQRATRLRGRRPGAEPARQRAPPLKGAAAGLGTR